MKVEFTGFADGSVSLPRVAQYGVSAYIVPICLGIWFWGTCGIMSILWAILLVSIVHSTSIQCSLVFGLKTSLRPRETTNYFRSNAFLVRCDVSLYGE